MIVLVLSHGSFSKEVWSLTHSKSASLVTQATWSLHPDTFLFHRMIFWLRLWTNCQDSWILLLLLPRISALQCENLMFLCTLVFHFYNGTTNSLPTVVTVKTIIFTNPPEHYWTAQKKKCMLIPAWCSQLRQADYGSVGTTAFKTGHARKGIKRHNEHSY